MYKYIRIAFILTGAAACGQAQWINYRSPGIPRKPDGKPNLTAPAPRTSNGKPDFSGLWQVEPSPWAEIKPLVGDLNDVFVPGDDLSEFSKYGINILADFKREEAPIRPEVAAKMRQRQKGNETEMNPCLPGSITFMNLIPATNKWIQTPGLIVILQEAGFNFRQVYLDGRKPPSDALPLWLGYSVGKWEGDTLVVDTTGFNDKTVLDAFGNPHSDALHLTERYHRRDYGHLDVELTVDDPKIYTKPFTIKYTDLLLPDSDILEYVCEENEKDARHLAKQ
jgi:hypothetical protein